MQPIIDYIRSSYTFDFLAWLIGPAWHDPIGRTTILTVLAYSISFLVFTGYLSYFAGGFGGLSASRLGIGLGDLIALVPSAIFTLVEIWPRILRSLVISFLKYFLVSVLPWVFGLIVGYYLRSLIIQGTINLPFINDYRTTLLPIGFYTFLFGAGIPSILVQSDKPRWRIIILCMIAQAVGAFFVAATMLPDPSAQAELNKAVNSQPLQVLCREITVGIGSLIIVFLLPVVFGKKIAEFVVQDKVLSRTTCLTLTTPLADLSQHERKAPPKPVHKPTMTWKQRLLGESIPVVETKPDVYAYDFPNTPILYFLETFRNSTAFYLINANDSPEKGKLIVIAQETIIAMTLESPITPITAGKKTK